MTDESSPTRASVLVTGCSAGIGHVIAKTLAEHGHRVFATMRDPGGRNQDVSRELTEWADAEGLELAIVELDVESEPSVQAGIEAILASGSAIDVVVNNAGISASGPVEAFSDEQVAALYNVNCFGQIRVDRAILPHMRARGSGLLIHMSSTLGRVLPGMGGIYPATKWAVEGIAESIAYEVRPFGIDVVILEPGAFPTTAVVRGMLPANEAVAQEYAARVPLLEQTMVTEPPPDYVLPDLREVGEEVAQLIALPAGERPLRSIVGPIFTEGVPEYNRQYELTQETLRRALDRPDQAITWV